MAGKNLQRPSYNKTIIGKYSDNLSKQELFGSFDRTDKTKLNSLLCIMQEV